jgi:hypothetical protein
MYVFTGSGLSVLAGKLPTNNQLCILIGLERNCQQMRRLAENEIPPACLYKQ